MQTTAEMLKTKEHLDGSPLGMWCSNGHQGKPHVTTQLSSLSVILATPTYVCEGLTQVKKFILPHKQKHHSIDLNLEEYNSQTCFLFAVKITQKALDGSANQS